MAYEYKHLDAAGQDQMLKNRVLQLEQEHYAHEMVIQQLVGLNDDSDETKAAIANSKAAQATIESAITSTEKEQVKVAKKLKAAEKP